MAKPDPMVLAAVEKIVEELGAMIADHYGRSPIEADFVLAAKILARLGGVDGG